MSLLGYNTNGFAHHRLEDALDLIAGIGYRSVGLTLDVHHAPPGATDYRQLGRELSDRGLLPVVETGARFLLDPRRKHFPTLMSAGRERRIDIYRACLDAAAELGAPCISLWSGAGDDRAALVDGLGKVLAYAAPLGIEVGFEPEPGMHVETMAQYDELKRELPQLRLTVDVGHVHCLEEERPESVLDRYREDLVNVHLDDHRRGVHEHLMFGEGEIEWDPVLAVLAELEVPATVELSRHSPMAVEAAERAFAFLANGV
ncbi:MAG: sugar phosphate isomerase/epimerase family protein [Planctomycetota bacterium]